MMRTDSGMQCSQNHEFLYLIPCWQVIPGALAAIVPAVLGGSPGLMCLPALYAVTLRGKKIFLYFWAAPMVLLVLYLLHTGMAMPLVASDLALAVLPIAIPIALHYAAVKVAIDWRVSSK